jgi:hypothetical protein
LQVGDTGPVESARRSNSRVLGSPFSGLSGHTVIPVLLENQKHNKLGLAEKLQKFSHRLIELYCARYHRNAEKNSFLIVS